MSKFDNGKHILGNDENGRPIVSKKRLDGQAPPKKLVKRQEAYTETLKTVDGKLRQGYHRPGSQNRAK